MFLWILEVGGRRSRKEVDSISKLPQLPSHVPRAVTENMHRCFGSGSVWIRLISATRIGIRFIYLKKILNFCLTDINIYLINNKTIHFLEKYILIEKKGFKKLVFSPDPLFHETNPRIQIRIKMKRIRNIDMNDQFPSSDYTLIDYRRNSMATFKIIQHNNFYLSDL